MESLDITESQHHHLIADLRQQRLQRYLQLIKNRQRLAVNAELQRYCKQRDSERASLVRYAHHKSLKKDAKKETFGKLQNLRKSVVAAMQVDSH